MNRVLQKVMVVWLSSAAFAWANEAQQDVLAPQQGSALTWAIGIGILVLTLIAGFKHPGRTHLD